MVQGFLFTRANKCQYKSVQKENNHQASKTVRVCIFCMHFRHICATTNIHNTRVSTDMPTLLQIHKDSCRHNKPQSQTTFINCCHSILQQNLNTIHKNLLNAQHWRLPEKKIVPRPNRMTAPRIHLFRVRPVSSSLWGSWKSSSASSSSSVRRILSRAANRDLLLLLTSGSPSDAVVSVFSRTASVSTGDSAAAQQRDKCTRTFFYTLQFTALVYVHIQGINDENIIYF